MTKQEAIWTLRNISERNSTSFADMEAIDMACKALEAMESLQRLLVYLREVES